MRQGRIHRIHGHRHQYAQKRYREFTGWAALAAGGPGSKDLTAMQKVIDKEARLTISSELLHSRAQILGVYCGSMSSAGRSRALAKQDCC